MRYLLLLICLYTFLVSCKKDTGSKADPTPIISVPPVKGEVVFTAPVGEELFSWSLAGTSDSSYFILGGVAIRQPQTYYAYYPMFVNFDKNLNTRLSKTPLTTDSATTIRSMVESNSAYYFLAYKEHNNNNDMVLIKTDKSYNVLWNKIYQKASFVFSINMMPDHNLLVQGAYGEDFYGGDPNPSFLMKLDEEGNIIFRKDYPDLHYGGNSVAIENTGYTMLMFSRIDTINKHRLSPVFCKTDLSGNLLTAVEFSGFPESMHHIITTKLIKNTAGGYFFVHRFADFNVGGQYVENVFLEQLDSQGTQVSINDLTNVQTGGPHLTDVADIIQTHDQNIYILLILGGGNTDWQIAVAKYSKDGQLLKAASYGQYNTRYPESIVETPGGELLILSAYASKIGCSVIKINKDLVVQ